MLFKKGKETISEARNEASYIKKILLFSVILNIGTGSLLGYVVVRENTIIVPPVVSSKYQLNNAVGSELYLIDISEYVITTLRTINPNNIDNNNLIILRMTDSASVPKLRSVLEAQAIRLKKEDISTVWSGSTQSPKVIVDKNTVFLTGTLKTYFSDKLASEEPKKYKLTFKMSGIGKIYVKSVEEVKFDNVGNDVS